jgi:two-component system, cell cycle sensor histidine kinase and response regulator CckA
LRERVGSKSARQHAEMATGEQDQPRSVGAETIMLVEDESFVRGVTRQVLESAGYSVVAVGNATEAQHVYDQRSGLMDLLLTDIVLPGENGRRLAKRLSQDNSALQVLLVTGHLAEMEAAELQENGENLLRKPFAASTLLLMVRQLLDRRTSGILNQGD